MNESLKPYFFALAANFAFAWATVAFAHFSRIRSPLWMNTFKASAAMFAFLGTWLFIGQHSLPELPALLAFLASGFLGLNIGDWFLLRAFKELGASRTLILYGFQPLMLGFASYFLFSQTIDSHRLISIFFLVGCLFVFSLENLKKTGHWGIKGLLVGLIGIALDAVGVILTRYGFDASPNMGSVDSNLYRCIGAVIGFLVLSKFVPISLYGGFQSLKRNDKILLITASLSGTFLSLFLYLTAIQTGHLATISGIAITSPLFAGIVESFIDKKPPSRYLVVSFLLFAAGFLILII